MRAVLFSIRPQWSTLILDGAKTVELRRTRCGCAPGTQVVIYTSFPVKRVQGAAIVPAVHALQPQRLWSAVGPASCVPRAEFFEYLGDVETAYGIELTKVRRVADLALSRPGPQSWRYLRADDREDMGVLEHVTRSRRRRG